MIKDKPYLSHQTTDDKKIVEEMLRDPRSGQWYEWYLFVNRVVHLRTNNLPPDQRDDVVQEAMMRIHKYLPTFQFQCAFKSWVFHITHSCIIDTYRKSRRAAQVTSLTETYEDAERIYDSYEGTEAEGDMFGVQIPTTVEDECIMRDELREASIALQEFVSLHTNSARNRKILVMVLFENRSLEETAQAVGCSAPVVGYVVRSARRYIREKLGY